VGLPQLNLLVTAEGIASLTAFGTAVVRANQTLDVPGIASTTQVGTHTVSLLLQVITCSGIPSTTAVGSPYVIGSDTFTTTHYSTALDYEYPGATL
jgi:hypothetical protein